MKSWRDWAGEYRAAKKRFRRADKLCKEHSRIGHHPAGCQAYFAARSAMTWKMIEWCKAKPATYPGEAAPP